MKIKFAISCELDYVVYEPSEFWFNVQGVASEQQRIISENLNITGARSYTEHRDPHFGNRFIHASADAGSLALRYSTALEVEYFSAPSSQVHELDVAALPMEVMPYVLPSRYCQSDRLIQLATNRFGDLPRGYERVEAVCDWVRAHVRFTPGATTSQSSAEDILVQGTGVCRDFAHLTIALLRALNIPARFVTAYDYGVDPIWGPTDFHAYVDVYLGDRWWIFDPSGICPRNGLVRIGGGRDAADVAFATIFGPAKYLAMRLDIVPSSELAPDDKSYGISSARGPDVSAYRRGFSSIAGRAAAA